jgi:hypothetical protein
MTLATLEAVAETGREVSCQSGNRKTSGNARSRRNVATINPNLNKKSSADTIIAYVSDADISCFDCEKSLTGRLDYEPMLYRVTRAHIANVKANLWKRKPPSTEILQVSICFDCLDAAGLP